MRHSGGVGLTTVYSSILYSIGIGLYNVFFSSSFSTSSVDVFVSMRLLYDMEMLLRRSLNRPLSLISLIVSSFFVVVHS